MAARRRNKYCSLSSLQNESDVEQFLTLPLLNELGYSADYLQTKAAIAPRVIDKGKRRKSYFPDYIAHSSKSKNRPVLIVDAKHPGQDANSGVEDAQLYASMLRRTLTSPKPDQYCMGINGHRCLVKHFDSQDPIHTLEFHDLVDGNPKFESLKAQLSRLAMAAHSQDRVASDIFEFRTVTPSDLPSIFETCHRKIWKTEKRSPASAFYEFSKLMYVKIDQDRQVRERLKRFPQDEVAPEGFVPRSAVHFASHWIAEMEQGVDSPVNVLLFGNLSKRLEEQIVRGEKKRIFDEGEGIDLAPTTIKEVVRLLENLDLGAVDEDLNGRMFETFLTATMRGRALGQFFTPRSVVKFMVKLADLKVTRSSTDSVLDGCCGTGGFLIEAMAAMSDRISANASLSNSERSRLMQHLRTEALWGVDAGTDPEIARIARLNMLLHRDGGSRIYRGDLLDKDLQIDPGSPLDYRLETDELRAELTGAGARCFSIILTNPPFSMNYQRKDPSEERVLRDYVLSVDSKGKQRASLRSSVMFLERYWELLTDGGRLVTVMDDSVLNTASNMEMRDFIMDRFVVVAVIGLPKNTFVKAQGSVGTSVLLLRKKLRKSEQQPVIYMALCGNVGHTDSGKERPELNQLPDILDEFHSFLDVGDLSRFQDPIGFLVEPNEIYDDNETRRLDAAYYDPKYFESLSAIERIADERNWSVTALEDILDPDEKVPMTGGATPSGASYPDFGPKFVRVQNVRPNRLRWSFEDDVCISTVVHNGQLLRSQLQSGDVIFTITGTYGVAAVVPEDFGAANINQHSVRIRADRQRIRPEYLAVFLNSSLSRPQIDRSVTGSSRPALDYPAIRRLRIVMLRTLAAQDVVVAEVTGKIREIEHLEEQLASSEEEIHDIFG